MAQEMAVFGPPFSEAKYKSHGQSDSWTVWTEIFESCPFSIALQSVAFFSFFPLGVHTRAKTLFSSLFYNGI